MRVVVPFTHLSNETAQALAGETVEFIDVSGSDTAYFDLLESLWFGTETFAIIEQDIVVAPRTLASFDACSRDYCCAPYPYFGSAIYAGLGCVRFRPGIMQRAPNLMDLVALHNYEGHGPKHWCTLDAAMQRELAKRSEPRCLQHAHVGHLHPTPTHGCC